MSKIEYDPVKDRFAGIIRNSRPLRRIFYALLDLFFLRSWHIRNLLKTAGDEYEQNGEWQLLDAGCGFGQYDRFILNRFENVEVDAVDIKTDYLEDNKHFFQKEIESGRIHFGKLDLLSLEKNRAYDFALCVDVLEHIEQDQLVMNNLHQALKRGGTLLIHSPSHYSEGDAGGEDSFVGEHARTGYSKNDIQTKLNDAGFKRIKTHYTYGFWGHKAWVLSVKWPMIWFNRLGLAAVLPLLLYYPIVMPFCLFLNWIDLFTSNPKGNGIYAIARK